MNRRPRILITRAEVIPGEQWDDYAACIRRAGGEPIDFDVAFYDGTLPDHDGVIVTAGIDVDPGRYGHARHQRVLETNPARDEVEAAIIERTLEARAPLFCICRGFQLLNAVLGGALLQHMEQREPHRARRGEDGESIASGWHPVRVADGSLLRAISGAEVLEVNSRHHQAVTPEYLAPLARAVAVAPDGIIEAMEVLEQPWALGVQWHPERPEMTGQPSMAAGSTALFEAFVQACQ